MADIIFAIVIDGEVAGTLVYPENGPRADITERHTAALRSSHTIVEATGTEVKPGWSYDGSEFHPPAE
jgi:hypothetical protein